VPIFPGLLTSTKGTVGPEKSNFHEDQMDIKAREDEKIAYS
jgi:hypothetical protein